MLDHAQSPSDPTPRADAGFVGDVIGAGPSPLGRRAFIAGVAGAAAATAVASTVDAALPAGASYYEPLTQVRLADTRPEVTKYRDFTRISDRVIRIQIAGKNGVPSDAVAAVISIVGISNGQPGWVRGVPAGQDSEVANVILEPADAIAANLATVKLSSTGAIDIVALRPYHVIVDISGVYRSTTSKRRGGRLKLLDQTVRVAAGDFIGSGKRRTYVLNQVPASAKAVVANVTAAATRANGYLTAFPTGLAKVPDVTTVNFVKGEFRGAGAIVKIGVSNGKAAIDVYALGGADVYIDVSGYITGDSDAESDSGLFVPVQPIRLLDTRRNSDIAKAGGKRRLWPRWSRAFTLPNGTNGFPAAVGGAIPAQGVALNLTSVSSMNPGFVTVLAAQTIRRDVTNLNISRVGQTVANHVITPVSTKGVECFSLNGAHIVCDVAGWYVGAPKATTLGKPADPNPPAAQFNWELTVPAIGLANLVRPNVFSGDPVVDVGDSWHWTNTGLIGESGASIVAFGHRTSRTPKGNGPYRNQHLLNTSSRMYIRTSDERLYTYRYVREELTSKEPVAILTAARRTAGSTFSLVACTGSSGIRDDQPRGGIRYRIVTTFILEQWADTSPTLPG